MTVKNANLMLESMVHVVELHCSGCRRTEKAKVGFGTRQFLLNKAISLGWSVVDNKVLCPKCLTGLN